MELLPLVCLCLLSCSGDAVRVVVEQDSDAVLNCSLSTKEDISGKYFDWKKDGQKEVFQYDAGIHYNNGLQGQDEQFKGRVSFFQDQLENGDASIEITRTKMADSGIYSCDFPRHQPSQTSIIELVVAKVRVLVEEDSDAVLPCLISPKEDITRKAFDWKKDGQDVFFNDPAGRTTQGRDFTGRVSRFEDQLQNGNASIKITRTKKTDSGNYSCIFPNLQSQTSIIELVVGASSKPYVRTVITDDGVILQCEVLGASPKPKVEWKDSSGNILQTEEPQVTESGGGYDIVLRAAVTKTDTFRCVVTQEEISHQTEAETYASVSDPLLRDRTGEKSSAAPEPYIRTLKMTKDWALLQCEARGVPPLTVEWKNGAGNILNSESTPVSATGSPSSITLNITVTKTDDYSCVATQEQFSHEIAAVIPVNIEGSNTGAIVGGVVGGAALIIIVLVVVIIILCRKLRSSRRNTANGPTAAESSRKMLESSSAPV